MRVAVCVWLTCFYCHLPRAQACPTNPNSETGRLKYYVFSDPYPIPRPPLLEGTSAEVDEAEATFHEVVGPSVSLLLAKEVGLVEEQNELLGLASHILVGADVLLVGVRCMKVNLRAEPHNLTLAPLRAALAMQPYSTKGTATVRCMTMAPGAINYSCLGHGTWTWALSRAVVCYVLGKCNITIAIRFVCHDCTLGHLGCN